VILVCLEFDPDTMDGLGAVCRLITLVNQINPQRELCMSSLDEKVKKIIAEQLSVAEDQITPEASFVEDLGADSLDTVELVMALEE
jgi:hypothetical protein